jgi:hypothetical protein
VTGQQALYATLVVLFGRVPPGVVTPPLTKARRR